VTVAASTPPAQRTATGYAFGLFVEAAMPVAGLLPAVPGPTLGSVTVESGAGEPADWPVAPQMCKRDGEGRVLASLHSHPTRGFRLYARSFGTFDLSAAGDRIECRPDPQAPDWLWQRFLLGQVLPFAAVLHGVEPFHASAVVLDGRTIAIAGGSGAGKSSLALNLVAAGASFVTDDVVAVLPGSATLTPGPPIANVRDPQLRERAERGEPPFGRVLGRGGGNLRVEVTPGDAPGELAAMYFVDRSGDHPYLRFEACDDPFTLLGHTFNTHIRSSVRLPRQLDTCGRISEVAKLTWVRAPKRLAAPDLARELAFHARCADSA
jgi:hypothetical protein